MLRGEDGADTLIGGAGLDWANYATSDGAVIVNLGANTGSGFEVQGDSYNSIERVWGSDYDDVITGDAADNYLRGGAGDDFLRGDGGVDTFVFEVGTGADRIIGFDTNEDLLNLSAFDAAEPLLSAVQTGNHVVFTFASDTVTLLFTDIDDLDAGLFV